MPRMSDQHRADWRDLNHAWWEERAPLHLGSAFYREGRSGLEDWEWVELPTVDGLDIIHLQCHIGTDTIHLARAGARTVGLDFSANATAGAASLAAEVGLAERTEWVTSDVYDAPTALDGRAFDAVYTGKGALCWLPDLDRWAEVVAGLIRPGGFLYLSEFHPFPDIMSDDDTAIERGYFPHGGFVYDEPGSYVDRDAATTQNLAVDFVHPISEVLQAILDHGLVLRFFHEQATTVFPRWPWLETTGDGVWHMPADRPSLPLMYSLRADKPANCHS